jgi:hypothetical protein
MKKIILLSLFLCANINFAQTIISGKILDDKNKPITGANVFIEGSYNGSLSKDDGSFEFKTSLKGNQILVLSFLTYLTQKKPIVIENFKPITINLKENMEMLDGVVLTAGTFSAGEKARASVLKPLDIVTTAGAAGNIIGALQTLPGTQTVGEDGRLFVRGGDAGESLTFVDGLKVAQPYGATANNLPTRGRFSPFLFDGITFSTGGYSSEFGNAMSGVLLLNTINEPDQNKTEISAMTVGAGFGKTKKWKENSLSVNFSYINLRPYQELVKQNVEWINPFQTISGEMVFRQKTKNGLLKFYSNFEHTNFKLIQDDLDLGRILVDISNNNLYNNISYKHFFDNSWTFNLGGSLGYSKNKVNLATNDINNEEIAYHLKYKLSKKLTNKLKLDFGTEFFSLNYDENFNQFNLDLRHNQIANFAELDYIFSKNLGIKTGVRHTYSTYNQENIIEPRVSFAYKTGKKTQFSLAYGQFSQLANQDYIKFAKNLTTEQSQHYIFNYQYEHNKKLFRTEIYYKNYDNLTKYSGNQVNTFTNFNNNGSGFAKGIDVFYRDNSSIKNLEYWVSYSYIDSERDYKNFKNQARPNFIADHTASIVTKYWIEKLRSQVGFSHTFTSGRPYNNPNESIFMNGKTKAFNNLSFNWAYLISPQKILYFSASNIMGTENVFGYQFSQNPDNKGVYKSKAITQPADRFFFVGFFWTISDDKKSNNMNNL